MTCGCGMTCILPNTLSGSTSLYLLGSSVIFTVGTMTMSCGYGMTCILPNTLSGSTSLYLLMQFCYIYRGDYDYELWLCYDLYTSKHTQWFYFSILVNAVLLYLQWGL